MSLASLAKRFLHLSKLLAAAMQKNTSRFVLWPLRPARFIGLISLLVFLCRVPSADAQLNGVSREVWLNINGAAVSDLTNSPAFFADPSVQEVLTNGFEAPVNQYDLYGQRLRAWLTPPTSGDYIFLIASDDASQLFISTDATPLNRRLVASVEVWTPSRSYHVEAGQKSAAVPLTAGTRYYIEALMKEGSGGDNLAVTWQKPGETEPSDNSPPIPDANLAPYVPGPPVFAVNPTNTTAIEGGSVSFLVQLAASQGATYRWVRSGTNISGATSPTLTISPVVMADNGSSFYCSAVNAAGTSNSTAATLTVIADTNRPVLLGAYSLGYSQVLVRFSERISPPTGTNTASYTLNGTNGSVSINSASLDNSQSNVVLSVAPMTDGATYLVAVNNVRDQSVAGNLIAPNSQTNFIATAYVVTDIGGSTPIGALVPAGNGWNIAGGGTDIGSTNDQGQFSYLLYTGDFDVQVRLDSLSLAGAWSEAGMLAREDLSAGARSAGVFATPGINGCYFQFRSATDGTTTGSGSFPPNYPDQWLRLKRVGDVFTAYAGFDGKDWTQLGTATLAMQATIYFGFGVSSHNTSQLATAAFRDFHNVTNTGIAGPLPFEPLGPSSRKTGLVISEIMYHPPPAAITGSLEFVEIYNSDLIAEDLSGYRLSGDIDFPFPSGTILPSGGFVVVARNPAALQTCYGISGVLGPFTNNLSNNSGTVRLRNELDGVLVDVNYDSKNPWPASPDGAGHSLVLRRPSYGESDPRAWAASDVVGGSPGRADSYGNEPLRGVVINEILAHTDPPELDSIELFNPGNQPVNLNGCILTDDSDTNRFVIGNVTVPARGFVYFTETQLGYRLDAAGETLYLKNAAQTRVIDAVRFEEQENGVAIGRYPDGTDDWYRMGSKTFGAANSAPSNSLVVLNEIMYSPLAGDDGLQYVELYNRGPGAVNLGGWELKDGISFTFASNTIVAAGGYIVVANNLSDLLTNYPSLNTNNTVGNFGGNLSHRGERIALTKPVPHHIEDTNGVVIATNTLNIVVDEVTYGDGGRWGQWSDGGGSSLELIDPRADRRRASNWADSDESAKAPWTFIERTGRAQLGMSTTGNGAPNRFEFLLQGPGECLVDDMECRNNAGTNFIANPGFESGAGGWAFQGYAQPIHS